MSKYSDANKKLVDILKNDEFVRKIHREQESKNKVAPVDSSLLKDDIVSKLAEEM